MHECTYLMESSSRKRSLNTSIISLIRSMTWVRFMALIKAVSFTVVAHGNMLTASRVQFLSISKSTSSAILMDLHTDTHRWSLLTHHSIVPGGIPITAPSPVGHCISCTRGEHTRNPCRWSPSEGRMQTESSKLSTNILLARKS